MTDIEPSPVVLTDETAFLAAATDWRPGQPFPLLSGPELDRAVTWLHDSGPGFGELPGIRRRSLPGAVVACGGPAATAVAELLARATARPLHRAEPADVPDLLRRLDDSYVALVGLADDVETIGDWMGDLHPGLGVITARRTNALAALVYRSLTDAFLGPAPSRRLVHPLMPDSQDADVVGVDDLDALRTERSGLLVLRSHGRECCMHLPDAILCGRSDAPGTEAEPRPEGRRIPACLEGRGCYRHDLEPEARVPAYELAGSVVYIHACDPLSPGVSSMPSSVNFSLGLIEGTAVAVIGSIGRQRADPHAERVLEAALRGGARLGDAVRTLNSYGEQTGGEMSRVGLLGDPALTFRPGPAEGEAAATPPSRPAGRGTPAPVAVDPAHTGTARRLSTEVLPALARLRWMDVPVDRADGERLDDAVRRVAHACLQSAHQDAGRVGELLDGLAEDLLETQFRTLSELADVAHGTWWQYGGSALSVYRQIDAVPVMCPHCHRDSARVVRYRHRVCEDVEMGLGLCRRCGPWEWHSGALPGPVAHTAPMDVVTGLGEPVTITATLVNQQPHPVRGAAAVCFVNGAYEKLPDPVVSRVTLRPGEKWELPHTVRPDRRRVGPDVHEAMFMTLLDGRFTALPVWLDVRRH